MVGEEREGEMGRMRMNRGGEGKSGVRCVGEKQDVGMEGEDDEMVSDNRPAPMGSIRLSVRTSVRPSIRRSIRPSIRPSLHLSVRPSAPYDPGSIPFEAFSALPISY